MMICIKWISAPASLEPKDDYKTSNKPWASGRIIHEGSTIHFRKIPEIENYVRAVMIRSDGDETYRTYTNPFGITQNF